MIASIVEIPATSASSPTFQVNPHVSSFMDAKGGVLHSLRGHFGFDLQSRGELRAVCVVDR